MKGEAKPVPILTLRTPKSETCVRWAGPMALGQRAQKWTHVAQDSKVRSSSVMRMGIKATHPWGDVSLRALPAENC